MSRFHANVAADYPDYLRDESRREGRADSISFPAGEQELRDDLVAAHAAGTPVTVQGARTGITAGAVPDGGHILNLSRMTGMTGLRRADGEDAFLLTVQPGLLLADLRKAVTAKEFDTSGWSAESTEALAAFREAGAYFFPPDPTEATASIGGMASCNASGAESFRYGPTRRYVRRARIVLADGDVLDIERGRHTAGGRELSLTTEGGREVRGALPSYSMPSVKSAAGYFVEDNMDLLDLFVGSEGTLGVFAELELKLVPAPGVVWGIMAFMPSEPDAVRFVETCRCGDDPPAALEFFDTGALELLQGEKESNPAFGGLPAIPPEAKAAVYIEYHGPDEGSVEEAVMNMSEVLVDCGGDEEATWMAADAHELERLKDFRHAVPEIVNLTIDERRKKEPRLTKLGTDLAVPDAALADVLRLYHEGLAEAGLEYVIFGHIGDNHVHVNIIPETLEQYDRAKGMYERWAKAVVAMGGTVSAEHGIGKLKTALLSEMFGEEGIRQMRAVKHLFDPDGVLNPGNLF